MNYESIFKNVNDISEGLHQLNFLLNEEISRLKNKRQGGD